MRIRPQRQILSLSARFLALSVLCLAAPQFVRAQSPDFVTYPPTGDGTGFWNGFLSQLNVVECSNQAPDPLPFALRVISAGGSELASQSITLEPHATGHYILNSMTSVQDSYGTYRIEIASGHEAAGPYLVCKTAVYRMAQAGSAKQVDYAYFLPIFNGQDAAVSGTYNSFNPEQQTEPVYNWLTVYNPGSSQAEGTLSLYLPDGTFLRDEQLILAAKERRDIPLGHSFDPGAGGNANGQTAGLFRLAPAGGAKLISFLMRYGSRAGGYTFAFPSFPGSGVCDRSVNFSSSFQGTVNWLELANADSSQQELTLRVRDRSGALKSEEALTLNPREQRHVFINSRLGTNDLGTAEVDCADPSAHILAQSLFYGINGGRLDWAYGSAGSPVIDSEEHSEVFLGNTFIGMANWLKAANGSSFPALLQTHPYSSSGDSLTSSNLLLGSFGGADLGLHELFGADAVGATVLSSSGEGFSSELLRVFPKTNGDLGYIMPFAAVHIPRSPFQIKLTRVTSAAAGLTVPTDLAGLNDGSGRLFVVEHNGRIRIIQNGAVLSTPYLDISSRVRFAGEDGLHSMAFDPNFAVNRYVYVYYGSSGAKGTLARYTAPSAGSNIVDPNTEEIVFQFSQAGMYHKAGQLKFGPDGKLYLAIGDGGNSSLAQDLSAYDGKILRIDVSSLPYTIPADNPFVGTAGAKTEIYAYGFRNEWRYSFDRLTGEFMVADVGQSAVEEIDLVEKGKNYGWPVLEGNSCYNPPSGCNSSGKTGPINTYDHSLGIAVIGGYVYRGSNFPEMYGYYFFGDYGSRRIWTLKRSPSGEWIRREMLTHTQQILSFGEDSSGETYLLDAAGDVYHIEVQ